MPNLIDLTGKTFGRWEVLKQADGTLVGRNTRWACRCTCGNVQDVSSWHLRRADRSNCCKRCANKKKYKRTPAIDAHYKTLTQPIWERVCKTCGVKFLGTARQMYHAILCRPK